MMAVAEDVIQMTEGIKPVECHKVGVDSFVIFRICLTAGAMIEKRWIVGIASVDHMSGTNHIIKRIVVE